MPLEKPVKDLKIFFTSKAIGRCLLCNDKLEVYTAENVQTGKFYIACLMCMSKLMNSKNGKDK
jgi:hypothetical protein